MSDFIFISLASLPLGKVHGLILVIFPWSAEWRVLLFGKKTRENAYNHILSTVTKRHKRFSSKYIVQAGNVAFTRVRACAQ